jgi:hypothetical protein
MIVTRACRALRDCRRRRQDARGDTEAGAVPLGLTTVFRALLRLAVSGKPGRVVRVACRSNRLRAADASWSEGAHVGVELFEAAGERFDVGVGERAGEVFLDPVVVLAAGACHRLPAFVGLNDED